MHNIRPVVMVSPLVLLTSLLVGGAAWRVHAGNQAAWRDAQSQRWVAPRAVLQDTAAAHQDTLQDCDVPEDGASFTVRLRLDVDGRVTQANVHGGDGDEVLLRCVQNAVRLWVFPPSDTPPVLSFPLRLDRGAQGRPATSLKSNP